MTKVSRVVAAVASLLAGCAATVERPPTARSELRVPSDATGRVVLQMTGSHVGAADWETFKGEWRQAFRAEAQRRGIAMEVAEDNAKPAVGDPGTLLLVRVDDYRYLTSGARYGFGIMTGNAFIESQIRFVSLADGQSFGEKRYSTSSSAWQGVFSAMTDKQVAAIASEVVGDLMTGPRVQAATSANRPAALSVAATTPAAIRAPDMSGQDSASAQRLPEAKACSPQPRPVLVAKGPGFETYTVACAGGESLSIRCEFGNCRALK